MSRDENTSPFVTPIGTALLARYRNLILNLAQARQVVQEGPLIASTKTQAAVSDTRFERSWLTSKSQSPLRANSGDTLLVSGRAAAADAAAALLAHA
jgi:hypothetical protein